MCRARAILLGGKRAALERRYTEKVKKPDADPAQGDLLRFWPSGQTDGFEAKRGDILKRIRLLLPEIEPRWRSTRMRSARLRTLGLTAAATVQG